MAEAGAQPTCISSWLILLLVFLARLERGEGLRSQLRVRPRSRDHLQGHGGLCDVDGLLGPLGQHARLAGCVQPVTVIAVLLDAELDIVGFRRSACS